MRRFGFWMACGLIVAAASTQAQAVEVAELIPDNVLVAVVVKDMDVLHGEVLDLVNRLVEGTEVPNLWDTLLHKLELKAQIVEDKPDGVQFLVDLPTTIDRKRPFVFLVPDVGEIRRPEASMAVMLPVTNYKKFLGEVARLESKPGDVRKPGQSVDGFDLVGDDVPGKGRYFTQRGDYAIMTPSSDAMKSLNRGKGNLLKIMPAQSRKLFAGSDVSVYANCDLAVRTFRKDLQEFVKTMQAQMDDMKKRMDEAGGAQPGMPMQDPAQVMKILKAEIELLLEIGEQLNCAVVGLNIDKKHVRMTKLLSAKPDTMLGRFVAAQKTSPLKLLKSLDSEAWLAGSFNVTPGSSGELQERMWQFMSDSGITDMFKDLKLDECKAASKELSELMSGETAFALYPPATPQSGLIRMVQVSECKNVARARVLMRKQVAMMVMGNIPGAPGLKFTTTHTENVEPGIDRTVMEMKLPDAADPKTAQVVMMMQMMYGGKIVAHYATAGQKYVLVSLGDPTTATIKAVMAKLAAGKPGTLTRSQGFVRATKGVPASRNGLCYLSVPRLMHTVAPRIGAMMGLGQLKLVMPDANDESGAVMATSVSGSTVRFDVSVPVQEMVNVKNMIERMAKEMGAGGAPPMQ